MKTETQIRPLADMFDAEMKYHSMGALDNYTISNRGIIYDPQGNEVEPTIYRGKKTIGINGYVVYFDYAVAKIWKGHPKGMTIVHKDGDPLNNDVDNLDWKPRHVSNYTLMKQRKPERPEGWIRRYTPDGILVREYKDVDQMAYELIKFGEVNETKTLFHFLRRSIKTGMYFVGSRWELSSPEVLPNIVKTLHTERYEGSVEIEEPTTKGTWIRRYCGPWLVQSFANIDEAVEHLMKHQKAPRKNILERLRAHIRGEERAAKTIAGCRWIASGEDALFSQVSQENWENAHRGNKNAAKKSKETFKDVEPIEETIIETNNPTTEPMEAKEERKPVSRPRKRTQTTETTTDNRPMEIEVEVIGFNAPKVSVEKIDSSRVRVRVYAM